MQQLRDYAGLALIRASKAHRVWAERELSKLGLRAGQEMILFQLWSEEGLTHSALAEGMQVEQPTVSIMLNRLERNGLVERRPDALDGRVSRVYLTPKGQALEQPVSCIWRELETRTLHGLTPDEQAIFKRLLCQVKANLEEPKFTQDIS